MNINIYQDYKVTISGEYCYLSEENETIYDNIFVKDKNIQTLIINGGKLMNMIIEKLQNNYISEFVIVGNDLHFEIFNYNNGESSSICFHVEEVEIKEN